MLHLGLFLSSKHMESEFLGALYLSQSATESAEDPNGDLRKLMYSLVECFKALKEDVEHLKGERSASTRTHACAPQGGDVDSISDSDSDSSSWRCWKRDLGADLFISAFDEHLHHALRAELSTYHDGNGQQIKPLAERTDSPNIGRIECPTTSRRKWTSAKR